jgi:hypothetical protein
MKKLKILVATLLLMACSTTLVLAQTSAHVTTTAGAVLMVPMTLTQTSPLHFGSITLLTAAAGTCVLSTSEIRNFTGGLGASSSVPLATNAAYNVTGRKNDTYSVTLPASITLTIGVSNAPTDKMTVNAFKARFLGANSDAITSKLSEAGTDSFTVGATLISIASQNPGIYAGSFDVTIDYN